MGNSDVLRVWIMLALLLVIGFWRCHCPLAYKSDFSTISTSLCFTS